MCACRCGIRVHLRDGEVRYIDGNPEHPLNQGVICAKGASGIMKQYSPARLTQPLMRKAGAERGSAQFEPVSWEVAFATLEKRLAHLRATDPKKFALFTGRDQMQALTGLFAKQFGTPNYAAHGGFCSANMAAGMIYTIGGSFWEFGGPDLDSAKLFFMIGTAEDHHSNPLKIALSKFKRAGGRFIAINPIRTGYAAIADEWVPIRPGTDGALFMALIHELLATDAYDREFVTRYTNAAELSTECRQRRVWLCSCAIRTCPKAIRCFRKTMLVGSEDATRGAVITRRRSEPALTAITRSRTAPRYAVVRVAARARSGLHAGVGRCRSPAFPPMSSAASPAKWPRPRAITRSRCRFQWTDAWGETHDTITGNPSPFTRCAVSLRTPTAFNRSARWRC
jgi:anaerobic selenocysteine-containing dehydrogenase